MDARIVATSSPSRVCVPASTRVPRKRGLVRAAVQYMRPQQDAPVCVMYPRSDGQPQQNCDYESVWVDIANARGYAFPPALDVAGFELQDAPTSAPDLLDERQLPKTYYPEVAELALLATGGAEAIVFDHQIRRREADRRALTYGRHGDGMVGPVGRVHNDYTEESGRRRLGLVLKGEVGRALDRRYCIVNVWRPIGHRVEDTPVAFCDARSVESEDLVPTVIRYPSRDGEAFQVMYRSSHRWMFFDAMTPDEAVVFKQYDSAFNVSRFTPHAAFDLPDIPPAAPLRTSIEARVLVLF